MQRPLAAPEPGRWLITPPVAPDVRLTTTGSVLAARLLTWLRDPDGPSTIEAVLDARPGGAVQSGLRVEGAPAADLALIAAASEVVLDEAGDPEAARPLAHVAPVCLGMPVAWLARRLYENDAFPDRCRWLAERGRHLRIRLRLHRLSPGARARQTVARRRAALPASAESWHPYLGGVEHAERLIDGCVFTLAVESAAPLGTAERSLLLDALSRSFGPLAQLGGPARPALAEAQLAERLLAVVGGLRADTLDEAQPDEARPDEARPDGAAPGAAGG